MQNLKSHTRRRLAKDPVLTCGAQNIHEIRGGTTFAVRLMTRGRAAGPVKLTAGYAFMR
jgi:hypothetical protein